MGPSHGATKLSKQKEKQSLWKNGYRQKCLDKSLADVSNSKETFMFTKNDVYNDVC